MWCYITDIIYPLAKEWLTIIINIDSKDNS